MEKKYLSELLDKEYRKFGNGKVFITAPTGLGKTTFVVEKLLPYLAGRGRKTLILCNRRLLREQYWYSLVAHYDVYDELTSQVEINSYQSLAKMLQEETLAEYLNSFQAVVLDEYHYFYADAVFNGFGTYVLLHALIEASVTKLMVFLSATSTEVKPLIEKVLKNCVRCTREKRPDLELCSNYYQPYNYDYSKDMETNHFECRAFPDEETMCEQLSKSEWKTLIFVDDKSKAEVWKNLLVKYGTKATDIKLLNADLLENGENTDLIKNLTIANRLSCKILLTTSVLDNGVSIHDDAVRNLVIITDSKLSFLQMLGRVRTENNTKVTLYFLLREACEFEKRMNMAREETQKFEEISTSAGRYKSFCYLSVMWNDPEDKMSKFYRKALVIKPTNMKLYTDSSSRIIVRCGDAHLVINDFARIKTGNEFVMESRLFSLAVQDPRKVIHEQMSWIGKKADELKEAESTYKNRRTGELVQCLCAVKDYSKEQLQVVKKEILVYTKELFPDVSVQNGTVSQEKLKNMCQALGLEFTQYTADDRKERYIIQPKTKV